MRTGRPRTVILHLSPAERHALRHLAFAPHVRPDVCQRAKALLLLARGLRTRDIAACVGFSHEYVYKWWRRWQEAGVAGLANKRRGQP